MSRASVDELRIRKVVASSARVVRASWSELLAAGLLLFVPLGLLTALAPGDGIEIERFDDPQVIPVIALGVVSLVAPLIGTVFFAGIVASVVQRERGGAHHGLRDLARSLPYWRLLAADVLLVLAIGFGLLLLVVPGIVALVWFCLVAPVIEEEDATLRAAFRRSRELVRGHFRQIAILVWPAVLLQSALEALTEELAFDAFGEGLPAEWFAAVAANLLADPIFALLVVVLYLELRELEGGEPDLDRA